MKFIELLIEGRISDFKQKFVKKFSPEQIEEIIDTSQSLGGRNKYLVWIGNVLESDNDFNINLQRVKGLLKIFNDQSENFQVKDIYKYSSIDDLSNAVKELENRVRRQVKSVEGADIIYEDDRFVVVAPLDYKASCYYGAGSKWCTASHTTTTHWETYNKDNKLFYFIDKTKPSNNVLYKVALLQNYNGDKVFWNALDKSFREGWILGTEEFERIYNQNILPYFNEKYSEEIEIHKDQERLKQKREEERIRAERLRRVRESADAELRRENNEWDPADVSGDDEGALANALLDVLYNENKVNILTPDDKARLIDAKQQLEELEERRREGGENEDEIINSIDALEDEISELEELFDVYDLIPDDTHYLLKIFKSNKEDIGEWAVGTYEMAYNSALQASREILDDVGIGGINESFLSSYIDEDDIVDDLKYYIESDVYDNPDVYLDETEDRELSKDQEFEIQELEEKIQILIQKMDSMKSDLDDMDDESDEYEELSELISNVEDEIYEVESEIENFKLNPEGDWDEDKMEDIIKVRLDDLRRDPQDFVENYLGQNWSEYIVRFINLDDVAEGIVDTDGFAHNLNTYDGIDRDTSFNGETYYAFLIND
jgi:hypothetical protein